ncbi:MAG: class I SAM-dependent methyltransferase [Candidatus Korarchaeota archaeon]|nr:class I SAM-dependent methyltransferase [Candidatus Korarchaeota archaeon]NIU83892.1 methyltransferase domain-containing protein [Candidatus Thorarchaeota archaeon]NIW14035.1 methyltransferase domain-containing protein [Candidatus Thorarchaeota archaeon]NIW51724.1 methyltransferase domain-containing protein [Candidatus Korarchaeota archaeon]
MGETEFVECWTDVLPSDEGKDFRVIDVGVGESTKALLKWGATVIGVDRDLDRLQAFEDADIPLLRGDVTSFPFRKRLADLIVLKETLHEIDPAKHREVLTVAYALAPMVIVVEPSPEGGRMYQRYAELWRKAMRSVGRFEEYQPLSYWKKLLKDSGFTMVTVKRIRAKETIPPEQLEEINRCTVEEWINLSVKPKYIQDMHEFLECAKKNGMKWSDLNVLKGEA